MNTRTVNLDLALPVDPDELEALARERLPLDVYDYFAGGADDERTVRGNAAAFARWWLRPRVLRDVSQVDTRVKLLGDDVAFPVLVAPTAFQRLAHPDGELATVRAAHALGTIPVVSTLATHAIEDIAAASGGPLWFQLYVLRDRGLTRALVTRAASAGCSALCVTVDVPVQGNRLRDVRNAFHLPPHIEIGNFRGLPQATLPASEGSGLHAFIRREFDPALTWSLLDWLRAETDLPIVLKGILTGEDAALALEHGADGVVVSNHGGRQLGDAIPASLALPEVADAVAGRIPVLVDGGIRRGTDVLKALALGADAVLVGRPCLWGLALAGEAGVHHVLATLRDELVRALALAGCPSASVPDRAVLALAE